MKSTSTQPFALLLAALLLTACSKGPSEPPQESAAAPQTDLAAGKQLAETRCLSCHTLDGQGIGPDIPNLGGQKEAYLLAALQGYRNGSRQHAALKALASELSEADVRNLAAYFAAQKQAAPRNAGSESDKLAAGKTAATVCGACHGADGNSVMPGTPSLAGQHPGFLSAAMLAYQSGQRSDAGMQAQMAKLDAVTMENIAAYYAAQVPAGRATPEKGNAAKGEPLSGKCGGCHGPAGHSADEKTPSLAGQDAPYLVKTMQNYRDGSRAHAEMQSMLKGIADSDLQHIAAFYASQAPKQALSLKPTAGKQWAERCDKCHGPDLSNPAMVAPYLEGQPVAYLVKALKDYRTGNRAQSAMHAMGAPLSDADIQVIAEHYASQAPR